MFTRISRYFSNNLALKRVADVYRMETKKNYASNARKNKLANQKSSYLLQHATNPVDWYPWGKEAMERAKQENKLIFLSVGYSTCHWCHVMERESFENEEIAEILNSKFISIKVDREERPDVDKVYMTYVQATHGSGGWPMSVWLTPDLKPIYGGTYYPPDNRYFGRPGFKSILIQLSQKWEKNPKEISELGTNVLDDLKRSVAVKLQTTAIISEDKVMEKILEQFKKMYEPEFGGFGEAPKFPQAVNFDALYCLHAANLNTAKGSSDDSALQMCLHTLRNMAKGGIHDHVGKGFHRYSTDKQWHVPHFEKMLYDQAQLVTSYVDAFQITRDVHFSDVARGILDYVIRDLLAENGGFYCAEDADSSVNPNDPQSDKKEGSFYVWTYEEIKDALVMKLEDRPDVTFADVFCKHYDVKPNGNVNPYQDPHDELKGKNVLIVREDEADTAKHLGIDEKTLSEVLKEAHKILLEVRSLRPRPHLDDKIVTAWNGLMISGFARAAQVLEEDRFAEVAKRAADHLRLKHFDPSTGMLLRSTYREASQECDKIYGFLDDYAFVIQAMMDLYETCYDPSWLQWALDLQRKQDELFWDEQDGAYFNCDPRDEHILLRLKEDQDGAEPSGNSIAVRNLLRLNAYFDVPRFAQKVDEMLEYFSARLLQIPATLPAMLRGLIMHTRGVRQVVICGNRDSERCRDLLRAAHSLYLPDKVLLVADASLMAKDPQGHLEDRIRKLGVRPGAEEDVAYVCHGFACSLPVSSAHRFLELLQKPHLSVD